MKKTKVVVIVIYIISFLLGTAAIAQITGNNDDGISLARLGEALKKARFVSESDQIIAKVNGKPITKKQFAECEAFLKFSNEYQGKLAPEKEDVIKTLAKGLLAQQEADNKGIKVSEQEIDQEIQRDREIFASASPENQQKLREYFEAQGINFDKYWASKEKRNAIKFRITMRKLIEDALSQAKTPEERHQVFEDAEKHLDELYKQAKIEMLE